jgi:beta-N-acetylhexosaminidase
VRTGLLAIGLLLLACTTPPTRPAEPGRQAPTLAPAATSVSTTARPGGLSEEQRVGQLFMVGLRSGAGEAEAAQTSGAIRIYNVGNVVLYGSDWNGADAVRAAVEPLQRLAREANGGVGLFVSGNQEGGQWGSFQAFYGEGFSPIPSPIAQAQGDPSRLEDQARIWGGQLGAAGVNLNLAPVLDTVPPGTATNNDPIGRWGRQYGSTPEEVSRYGMAFARGMMAAPVAVAVKHFPGLGRVTGNTDFTAEGIVDEAFSGVDDPYLRPFKAAVDAGVDFVMIALAIYPRVDAHQASFSAAIMDDVLRRGLGFQRVIISDDVGAAVAVADRPPAQRARDWFRAGGDMLLTVRPSDIPPMIEAVRQEMAADAGFRARIDAAVERVLEAKRRHGLLP